MTLNGWSYVEDTPVNKLDPSGRFSVDLIARSLAADGKTIQDVFGKGRYGFARWGLYALLKDAADGDLIYPLTMASTHNLAAPGRMPVVENPLYLSLMGSYAVSSNGCELVLTLEDSVSAYFQGPYSLAGFVDSVDRSGLLQGDPLVYWRLSTLANHWYRRNRDEYYSDYGTKSDLPDFVAVSAGVPSKGPFGISVSDLVDRYGNQYLAFGLSGGPGISLLDYAEGYVEGPLADEATLKKIANGNGTGVMLGAVLEAGAGFTPDANYRITTWYGFGISLGVVGNQGITSVYRGKDEGKGWNWVVEIPGYSGP